MLENVILGIIYDADLSGYEIKRIIEKKIGMFYKASFGSLYPALRRLEGNGCVSAYEKYEGARKKIFYSITEDGRRRFIEWLSVPIDITEGAAKNLVRIYFFDFLPEHIRNQLLERYEEDNVRYLNELICLEEKLRSKADLKEDYYKLSTLYYGIAVTQKTIEWCREIRKNNDFRDFVQCKERGL